MKNGFMISYCKKVSTLYKCEDRSRNGEYLINCFVTDGGTLNAWVYKGFQ